MKRTLILLVVVGSVVAIAHSPLARVVDRVLPGRVSLQSQDSPLITPTPALIPTIAPAGLVLDAEVTPGQTPTDGVTIAARSGGRYQAPFAGTIAPTPGGILYQSPQLAGSIEIRNSPNVVLAATGAIAPGQTLAQGDRIQLIRRDAQGQAIAPEQPLLAALQVGAKQ